MSRCASPHRLPPHSRCGWRRLPDAPCTRVWPGAESTRAWDGDRPSAFGDGRSRSGGSSKHTASPTSVPTDHRRRRAPTGPTMDRPSRATWTTRSERRTRSRSGPGTARGRIVRGSERARPSRGPSTGEPTREPTTFRSNRATSRRTRDPSTDPSRRPSHRTPRPRNELPPRRARRRGPLGRRRRRRRLRPRTKHWRTGPKPERGLPDPHEIRRTGFRSRRGPRRKWKTTSGPTGSPAWRPATPEGRERRTRKAPWLGVARRGTEGASNGSWLLLQAERTQGPLHSTYMQEECHGFIVGRRGAASRRSQGGRGPAKHLLFRGLPHGRPGLPRVIGRRPRWCRTRCGPNRSVRSWGQWFGYRWTPPASRPSRGNRLPNTGGMPYS